MNPSLQQIVTVASEWLINVFPYLAKTVSGSRWHVSGYVGQPVLSWTPRGQRRLPITVWRSLAFPEATTAKPAMGSHFSVFRDVSERWPSGGVLVRSERHKAETGPERTR